MEEQKSKIAFCINFLVTCLTVHCENLSRVYLTFVYCGGQAELEFEGHDVGNRLTSPVSPDGREQTLAFVVRQLNATVGQIYIHAIGGIYLNSRVKVLFVHSLI